MQNDAVWQTGALSEKERFRREINYLFVQLLRLRRNGHRVMAANAGGRHDGLLRSIKGFDHLMARLVVRLQRPSGQFVKAKIGGKRVLLNKCVLIRRTRMNRRSLNKILFVSRINRIIRNLIGFKSSLDSFVRFVGSGPRETLLSIMSTLNNKFYLSLAHSGSVPLPFSRQSVVTREVSPQGTSQRVRRKIMNKAAREADNKGFTRKVAIKKQALQKMTDERYARKHNDVKKKANAKIADLSDRKDKEEIGKNPSTVKPAGENTVSSAKVRKRAGRKETASKVPLERNITNLDVKPKKTDEGIKNQKTSPLLNITMEDYRKVKKAPAKRGAIKQDTVNDNSAKNMNADSKRSKTNQGLLGKKVTKKKEAIKENALKKAFSKKQPSVKPQPQPVEESSEIYVDSIIDEFTESERNQEQQNQDSRDSADSAASYIDGIILD